MEKKNRYNQLKKLGEFVSIFVIYVFSLEKTEELYLSFHLSLPIICEYCDTGGSGNGHKPGYAILLIDNVKKIAVWPIVIL